MASSFSRLISVAIFVASKSLALIAKARDVFDIISSAVAVSIPASVNFFKAPSCAFVISILWFCSWKNLPISTSLKASSAFLPTSVNLTTPFASKSISKYPFCTALDMPPIKLINSSLPPSFLSCVSKPSNIVMSLVFSKILLSSFIPPSASILASLSSFNWFNSSSRVVSLAAFSVVPGRLPFAIFGKSASGTYCSTVARIAKSSWIFFCPATDKIACLE